MDRALLRAMASRAGRGSNNFSRLAAHIHRATERAIHQTFVGGLAALGGSDATRRAGVPERLVGSETPVCVQLTASCRRDDKPNSVDPGSALGQTRAAATATFISLAASREGHGSPPASANAFGQSATNTRKPRRAWSCDPRRAGQATRQLPVLSCTTLGLSCPAGCPAGGRLLPCLFTLASQRAGSRRPAPRRYVFCDTFRRRQLAPPTPARCARRVALGCSDFPLTGCARLRTSARAASERQSRRQDTLLFAHDATQRQAGNRRSRSMPPQHGDREDRHHQEVDGDLGRHPRQRAEQRAGA